MDRTRVAAFTIAIAAVGIGGLLLLSPLGHRQPVVDFKPRPLAAADQVDIDKLQELASASCICERSGSEASDACWAEYRKSIANFRVQSYGSACYPLSTTVDCIATTTGEECVTVDYGALGLCTGEEARAAEQAALASQGHEDDAIAAVVERLRRGEKVPVDPGQGGCA